MKKSILFLVSFVVLVFSVNAVNAKTVSNSPLTNAIKSYKAGNYAQSYSICQNIVEKDPSNAVAYYYLAMSSVQIGRRDEAISSYEKVISLSTNRQLTNYATKGKTCIEAPEKCNESGGNDLDSFVRSKFGTGFSNEVRSDFEKKKIENLMREINRKDEIPPGKFKEYRDFSSQAPTNDEIVSAIRVLQRAGFGNIISNNLDTSFMYGKDSDADMLNLLNGNRSGLSPQVIQAMLTNQFTSGF